MSTVPAVCPVRHQPVVASGARHRLPDLLRELDARRVLLVTSARRADDGAVARLLPDVRVRAFTEWTPNPVLEQAVAAARAQAEFGADLIVAVGGGSAIDVAKLARSLPPDAGAARRVLAGRRELRAPSTVPLAALPTTAGSGSEVTRFATVYVDRVKHSLDHVSVLPEYALIDPELLVSCPVPLRYSSAFDALCHAVESLWSTRATSSSRRLATDALRALAELLRTPLAEAGPPELLRLAQAATTAGRAIDTTRTTAAHAFSYRLTAHFGVPHGVACVLNLMWLLDLGTESVTAGPPGRSVRDDLRLVGSLLAPRRPEAAGAALRDMLGAAGLSARLRDHGVHREDVDALIAAGMANRRTDGNPFPLDPGRVRRKMLEML
nr:phosphonoacetaldehyde reductase [uncultured Actinoplanes sp.]